MMTPAMPPMERLIGFVDGVIEQAARDPVIHGCDRRLEFTRCRKYCLAMIFIARTVAHVVRCLVFTSVLRDSDVAAKGDVVGVQEVRYAYLVIGKP